MSAGYCMACDKFDLSLQQVLIVVLNNKNQR